MQSFIFFILLLSSMALAGPIGRYPVHKRHDGHDDSAPGSTEVSGAFFIPPPPSPTGNDPLTVVATVSERRKLGFVSDGLIVTLASAGTTGVPQSAGATTVTAEEPTSTPASEAIVEAYNYPAAATTTTAAAASSASPTVAPSVDNKAIALAQNKFYATLSTSSSCDPTDPGSLNVCINGVYAKCKESGTYVLYTGCSKPLGCFALPLENGPGISVACTSADDAAFRMGLKSGSELEAMLGRGGSSSVVPTNTATVPSMSTHPATSTAMPTATVVTSSAMPAPTTTSTAVPTTASSSSAIPTMASSSSAASPTTTQVPVTTSSPSPVPTPTSTTAPPNNQAPVVTGIPISERYITTAGVVITTTIYE